MTTNHNQSKTQEINRRAFLRQAALWSGSAAVLAATGRTAVAATPARRPNVVFFLVDDMGWMDSTVYGSRYYETPNMERLARMSVRFTDAYSASPLCSPTRASIMTGKYPGRLHLTGASGHVPAPEGPLMPDSGPPQQEVLQPRCKGYLPLEEHTLAEALKEAGYRTGFIGKWHLGHDPKYWPQHQGFDENIGGGPWPGPPSYFSPYHISMLPDGPEGEYITDRLTDEAVRFIDESRDAPFFLNFWQYAIHAPYQGKVKYQEYFEQKKDPRGAQDNAVMGAMIKSLDESLGRILDKLEADGLMDNTIIIFTSDNGGNMYDRTARDGTNLGAWAPEGRTPTNNAPLRSGKGSIYEGGVRVPAMVYWPGVADREAISGEVITSVDYYPTILDMLEIKPRPGILFDGVSVVPALLGRKLGRDAIFCHFPHNPPAVPVQMSTSVRRGDWKLIRFYQQDEYFPNRIELYNLRDDIAEMHNLAEAHPRKARELEALMDRHLEETGANVPRPNPNYDPEYFTRFDGWLPSGDARLAIESGALVMTSTGGDPFMHQAGVPGATGSLEFRYRARSDSDGLAMFYWATESAPAFGPQRRVDFEVHHDGAWHEYAVPFDADTPLKSIRIDPSAATGRIELDWIQLRDTDGTVLKEWTFGE